MVCDSELRTAQWLSEIINDLVPESYTPQAAHRNLLKMAEIMGFTHFIYVAGKVSVGRKIVGWNNESSITIHNLAEEFVQQYHKGRFQASDPILHYAFDTYQPALWANIVSQADMNPLSKKTLYLAHDFDMKDGLIIPFHGPADDFGVLSFSTPSILRASPSIMVLALVKLYAQNLHECIRRHQMHYHREMKKARLSARETDILYWISQGKTAAEVAQIYGISHRTIDTHITRVREKLDSVNTTQAVAKAMTMRIIQPL
jgi:DNA-binding CsgD family transcriptional regulator